MKSKSVRLTVACAVAVLSVIGLGQAPAEAKTAHHQSARTTGPACC